MHERAQVGDRVGPRRARALGALVGQHACGAGRRAPVERVGVLHDRGVEDEPVGHPRVAPGVVERHLGAVGDAVDGQRRDAQRAADGVDVGHRVRAAVERTARPELGGAAGHVGGAPRGFGVDRRTGDRAGHAGAALVDQQQVAVAQQRGEDRLEVLRVRDGRAARTAGERQHGRPRRARLVQQRDGDRHLPRHAVAPVERDVDDRAAPRCRQAGRAGARADLRADRDVARPGDQHGQHAEDRRDQAATHGERG
jgi:hypothetical protein